MQGKHIEALVEVEQYAEQPWVLWLPPEEPWVLWLPPEESDQGVETLSHYPAQARGGVLLDARAPLAAPQPLPSRKLKVETPAATH